MNREIKNKIKRAGMVAFLLYIAALIYFLFFSESYGRAGFAEREYHYNVVPFREIKTILDLQRTTWSICSRYESVRKCGRIRSLWIYTSFNCPSGERLFLDYVIRICLELVCGSSSADNESWMF